MPIYDSGAVSGGIGVQGSAQAQGTVQLVAGEALAASQIAQIGYDGKAYKVTNGDVAANANKGSSIIAQTVTQGSGFYDSGSRMPVLRGQDGCVYTGNSANSDAGSRSTSIRLLER